MNIYSVIELENKIDKFAEEHEGEIPDALYEELVSEQMKSVQQIEGLVKYIKNLDLGIDMCDAEISRISKMKEKANKRIENIKKYITPFVARQESKITAGTFTLSTRKSESIEITDKEKIPLNYRRVIPETWNPDKSAIKQDIKKGVTVPGAELKSNDNLQIK